MSTPAALELADRLAAMLTTPDLRLDSDLETLSDRELLVRLLTHPMVDPEDDSLNACHSGNALTVAELSRLDRPALKERLRLEPGQLDQLLLLLELARRVSCRPLPARIRLDSPETVVGHIAPRLVDRNQEVFIVLTLTSTNNLIREIELTRGILNSSLVHPREVFRQALADAAAGIIVLHNHPSGEVQPSGEDRQITRRLVEAGELMNIPVLDHIIIGGSGYYSFREGGLIS